MDREWEIDVSVSDIGSVFTLLGIAVTSAVIGAAEIGYTMLWITSAYERNGKDFFLDLLYASKYTWTAEYVIVAGSGDPGISDHIHDDDEHVPRLPQQPVDQEARGRASAPS